MNLLPGLLVIACGLALIGFAAIIVLKRPVAERILRAFAGSARAHYMEQALRLIGGTALIVFSPAMWHSRLFEAFGWLLVATATALMLVPWRRHQRFSQWAVPLAIRHFGLYALAAFALGAFILYGVSRVL